MLNLEDDVYQDDTKFINFESLEQQRSPFNIPPIDKTDFNPPGFNYPGGAFTPPGAPKSPPPDYIPNKKDNNVQSLSQGQYGQGSKTVSSNSIKFCIFKYTYIWETNGRSYWSFLFNVDRGSISGFRWTGRNWVYFGVDLRRIDSFVCYRLDFTDTFY